MNTNFSTPSPQSRAAHLRHLLANEELLLSELARVADVAPATRLAQAPAAAFSQVAQFVDSTDFTGATEDARIWLHNRLGLYLARWFMGRHGGRLAIQGDPGARFYLQFVVTGMATPVPPHARLAPFAIAEDAIRAQPRVGLAALVAAAEAALTGGGA